MCRRPKKTKGRIIAQGGDERLDGETSQKRFLAEGKRGMRENEGDALSA